MRSTRFQYLFPPLPALVPACGLAALLLLMAGVHARAWGPHPAITQAALDVLGTNHPLVQLLGGHARRLTNYCWMADYKRLPFRDADQEFYADDYLLFPGMATHLDHICPEVKRTYAPYFKRALQAMRTESPANAARWIGSLLHFVEDTGSPPHAAEIRGPTHSKMENWVDATKIHLGDYPARNLGGSDGDDGAALEGFLRRMDELIAYSRPRGQRLMTPVLIGDRKAVEPVALECALETSRVVADLLHTLGELAGRVKVSGGGVRGRIRSVSPPRYEKVPARVVVRGSGFSTLAEPDGRFALRGLPRGRHEMVVFRPGSVATNVAVTVVDGAMVERNVELTPDGGLVRNGDLSLRWVKPDAPDCWYQTSNGWEGEVIALETGRAYRLRVDFQPGAAGEVLLRWSREVEYDLPQNVKVPRIEARPIRADNPETTFTAGESMGLLQITIRGQRPEVVCRRIELIGQP